MPSIAQIPTKAEVKRQNRFYFIFPTDVGGSTLTASVKSSARPRWQVTEEMLAYMNTKWWIPGRVNWDTWSCTFFDYIDDNTLTAMYGWWKLVYDPSSTLMNTPDVVKKNVIIQMLGPGLEGDIVETYTLYGTWPVSLEGGNLDMMADGTTMDLSVTFRYDYAVKTS